MTQSDPVFRRRTFLGAACALAAGAAGAPASVFAQAARLAPTPECQPGRSTPAQTEGPFYTQRTPLKSDFRADAKGTAIVLEGQVLTVQCKPVPGAWLDFWHADVAGDYDNAGFRMRGHQFADAEGRYRLETILPALYTGRTRHIHVKLRGAGDAASGGRILTTQVYFPDEAGNARDSLYRPELLARRAGASLRFDFVLPG